MYQLPFHFFCHRGCQDNNNNKVTLYLNEYYILYCEFIDRVFEKITNEIDK